MTSRQTVKVRLRGGMRFVLLAMLVANLSHGMVIRANDLEEVARQWPGGIGVLLSPEPAKAALEWAERTDLRFLVQVPDSDKVESVRRAVDRAGLLGTRVYVEQGEWSTLHLADNLADVVWVDQRIVAQVRPFHGELMRVVHPLGTVICGEATVKPYPDGADDWTHAYHGPDNNPQSTDTLAGGPLMTQFLAEPYYVPFPEVTVTSRGRIFKAFGNVGYKRRDWPWVNQLAAFNAYNGAMLWKQPIEEGFNIHRNTMVATPDVLYLADSKSCKLIDVVDGRVRDEIHAPPGASGPVWKWMAIENGVLYAMVGEEEYRDETIRGQRTQAGWPWKPMSSGYDSAEYKWGFGRTLFAIDLESRRVLWQRTESDELDGRAIVMRGTRVYYYSHPNFLACVDAATGEQLWKNDDEELLEAIGPHDHAQSPRLGFSTSAYVKCDDQAIYFAGPQRTRLVAASVTDGSVLWQMPHGNYHLVRRDEGLYALGRTGPSYLIEPRSGEILEPLAALRGNCTRVTGTMDSIFARGQSHGGTLRLTLPDLRATRIALMRPDCHDGVIAAGGLVHWGPWMCDCSLSLVGNLALAPAGDFQFNQEANEDERLESFAGEDSPKELEILPGDWPTYRSDNQRSASSPCEVSASAARAWRYSAPEGVDFTAPTAVGELVFVGGSDGIVRAIDATSGRVRWKAYTGGTILYPPTVADDRLFVGSGDGWIYALEAATGRTLWRFRAAPAERKISLYGHLTSTWPVASGVLAAEGTVYAAAGIASYDGTHVYALDGATGAIRWQNNMSGHMTAADGGVSGISVQGHLLLHGDRLYMAGGNVVSPAIYDLETGRCLNKLSDDWGGQSVPRVEDWSDPDEVRRVEAAEKELGKSPRGCELFLVDGEVVAFDRLLYSPKEYWAGRYFANQLVQAGREGALVRGMGDRLACLLAGRTSSGGPRARWDLRGVAQPMAMAVASNVVVLAGPAMIGNAEGDETSEGETYQVSARSLTDGTELWNLPLSAPPKWWGLAIDRNGHVLLTLQDGSLLAIQSSGSKVSTRFGRQ